MSGDSELIPTKYSKLKNVPSNSVQFIQHESHRSKGIKTNESKKPNVLPMKESETFDIKKAKHEVIRFGMTNFDFKKKEDATKALLIKLGEYFP